MLRDSDFGSALRYLRHVRRQSQEDLAAVSGRTYVSSLERNLQSPTLSKIDTFARALEVHPLTLLALCYVKPRNTAATKRLLIEIERQLTDLDDAERSSHVD